MMVSRCVGFNKRGAILELYLVMTTLFLSGLVLGFYIVHQDGLKTSLVSPLDVLEVQDDLKIFEIMERELIRKSLDGVDFGRDGFEDEFKKKFLNGIDPKMRGFILDDLFWKGTDMDTGAGFDSDSFFRNVLYSVDVVDSGDLILKRAKVGKKFLLEASGDRNKIFDFPIEFGFEFGKEYLISKKDGEIVVEDVENA